MSTPAPVRPAREAPPPRPVPTLAETPSQRPRRRPSATVWLTAIFAVAAAYHAVQGTMHVAPAVFTDELLHGGLARAFAAGTPFQIRDATAFFPAFLPALVAAPAWLVGDMETAYAAAKILNALVMSAACFPAYWLARQVVRPTYALLAAAATVAAPGMLYSAYLLSEPLAYPVFLLAVAVYVRALTRPSPRWWALAGAVSLLAVGTRMQFVALPVVLGLVLALRRRSALPVLGLLALGAAAVLGGTAPCSGCSRSGPPRCSVGRPSSGCTRGSSTWTSARLTSRAGRGAPRCSSRSPPGSQSCPALCWAWASRPLARAPTRSAPSPG